MGTADKQGQAGPGREELCLLGQSSWQDGAWRAVATLPPREGLPETEADTESRASDAEGPGLDDVAEPQASSAFGFFCLESQEMPVLAEASLSHVSVICNPNHLGLYHPVWETRGAL